MILRFMVFLCVMAAIHCGNDHDHAPNGHADHEHAQNVTRDEQEVSSETTGHDHDHTAAESTVLQFDEATLRRLNLKSVPLQEETVRRKIRLNGRVTVNEAAFFVVSPRISGMVEKIHGDIGQAVRRGETLCVLNSAELLELKSDYIKAFQEYRRAEGDFRRAEELYQVEALDRKTFLEREDRYKQAATEFYSLQSRLGILGFTEKMLRPVKKAVTEQRRLDLSDFLTSRYNVVSPAAGIIIERELTAGTLVDSSHRLYQIADIDELWVIFDAVASEIPYIKTSSDVVVHSDIYPEMEFKGRVATLMERIDEELRTLKVRVIVDNRKRLLKPNMYVNGTLTTQLGNRAVRIPAAALVRLNSQPGVFVESGNQFRFQAVTVLADLDGKSYYVRGVSPADRVVIQGTHYLKARLELIQGEGPDEHAGHQH